MTLLALYLFGQPRVILNDIQVHIGRRKATALLSYLAMTKRAHSRDALATFLWPELDQSRALAYLRRLLSELNKSLGETGLVVDRETACLNRASLWLDVDEFHQHLAIRKIHNHPEIEACEDCVPHLEDAVKIYQGEFMEGFSLRNSTSFDEWQFFQAEGLRREQTSALVKLVHWQHSQKAYARAINYARCWLALDPLHEPAHRSLMQLYAESGQRSAALRQYQLCVQILDDELHLKPSDDTQVLYEYIRFREEVKPDQVLSPVKYEIPYTKTHKPLHNLPTQLSSFVGRENEIQDVLTLLLRPDIRMLTLTGPGGTGKTRLSLAVAEKVLNIFPDGVFFVSLASLRDPALVLDTIAQTFGLRNAGDMSLSDIIIRFLMRKQLLLVLDNFEHMVKAAPDVATLMKSLPKLTVLITSRALLRVTGEHHYPVLPLHLPDSETTPNLQQIAQNEAVQLFTDRAKAVKPGFILTNGNTQIVADICTRLDGLPLAIELAAARVRSFSLQDMLSQLENRLHFLTGGAKDLPTRQRTLRDTIDWSFHLLEADEQVLFRRLAVFASGCTLQAAETVCNLSSDTSLQSGLCLDLLNGLEKMVDQSLLQQSEVNGTARFTMLATIREYALEKLTGSSEFAWLQQAHANFFLELAVKAEPQFDGLEVAIWNKLLECELENFRASLSWASENDIAIGLQLAAALTPFWVFEARLAEGRNWLEQLLAQEQGVDNHHLILRAKALYVACILAWFQGDSVAGFVMGKESVAIFRDLNDKSLLAYALWALAIASFSFPDSAETLPLLEECIDLFKENNNPTGRAKALCIYGWKLYTKGEKTLGRSFINECNHLAQQYGMLDLQATVEDCLGGIAYLEDDLTEAWSHCEKSLSLLKKVGNKSNQPAKYTFFGDILCIQGDYDKAKTYYYQSLAMYVSMGNTANIAEQIEKLGKIALRQERLHEAKTLYFDSLILLRDVKRRAFKVASCLIGLAQIDDATGHPERFVTLLGASEAHRNITPTGRYLSGCEIDRAKVKLLAYLDEPALNKAYNHGLSMTKEQAIAYALSEDKIQN